MNRAMWLAVVRAFRRAALPLVWYYAVTLVLPLANGAAQSRAAFVDHALVVLVVPPILIVLACAVREIARVLAAPRTYIDSTLCRAFHTRRRSPQVIRLNGKAVRMS